MGNDTLCNHITAITELKTAEQKVCRTCVEEGSEWVHLRTCQTCGITLCYNSSPMQHMSHHCEKESHPVVISSEPEEKWMYCYVDNLMTEYTEE